MNALRHLPLALALSACSAFTQQTWIVDAANGPGAHFTDVPPALAAAQDGDTIRVRAGFYTNAVTSRGVRMLGEGNPILVAGPAGVGFVHVALSLRGVPSGRTFVLRGFQLSGGTNSIGAEISACAGHVVLADITTSGALSSQSLQVSASRDVTLVNSSLGSMARASHSTLMFRNVVCRGQDAQGWPGGPLLAFAETALDASSCDLSICGGSFLGGGGILAGSPDRPGLSLFNGTTRIAAAAGVSIVGGRLTGAPAVGILTNGGTLDLEPAITATHGGSATVTRRSVLALHAAPAAIGATVVLSLYAETNDAYQLFASPLADAMPLGALGKLWLDPLAYQLVDAGIVGAPGPVTRSYPAPADPLLRGATFRLQALRAGAAGIGLGEPTVALLY